VKKQCLTLKNSFPALGQVIAEPVAVAALGDVFDANAEQPALTASVSVTDAQHGSDAGKNVSLTGASTILAAPLRQYPARATRLTVSQVDLPH
jgi:hypothetical protein